MTTLTPRSSRGSSVRRAPTAGDLTTLVRLAGELGEIADPTARTQHAVKSFLQLVGGRASVFADIDCDATTGRPLRLIDGQCFGFDGNEFLFFGCDFFSGQIRCPIADAYRYVRRQPTTCFAAAPSQLIDDALWQRSDYRNQILRPYGIDAALVARFTPRHRPRDIGLSIMREPGEPPAAGREQRLTQLFLESLGPLFVTTPPPPHHPELATLSPRLRKVLDGLLAGDCPKQIAMKHGLTLHTTYEYTKRLYRHFHVCGRGELLALFVKPGGLQ